MDIDAVRFDTNGLVPVIISDVRQGRVLTLAWANREALERTVATRETHLFSRSRQALWRKGETSGHTQRVVEVVADCDGDAVLYRVEPNGPACHTGEASCFHTPILQSDAEAEGGASALSGALEHLAEVLRERKTAAADDSYVAKLYAGGVDRIGKKIGEEATEVVIAAKNSDDEELVWETSDLLFHVMVLLEHRNISLERIGNHLRNRAKPASK